MSHRIRLALVLIVLVIVAAGCAPKVQPDAQPTQVADATTAPAITTASASDMPEATAVASSATPVSGGTLVRAMTSEPATIDPQGAPSSGLSLVLPYLFDTLVVRDVDNRLLPALAEKWEVASDGKTISMTLRSGVTFHDGSPLTADAVRLTFERFKQKGVKSPIYGGIQQIAGIEVGDDLTVRFSFKEPAANFWSTISMPYAGILSPASMERPPPTNRLSWWARVPSYWASGRPASPSLCCAMRLMLGGQN